MQPAKKLHLLRGEVATSNGAVARVDGDTITLTSTSGRLVATYDASRDALLIEGAAGIDLTAQERVSIKAAVLEVEVGSYELRAQRIVERAKDAFRTIDRLLETRARRARTVVERLLELSARRTLITSEEDTRVDGRRVLLG
jgi:hypothetical protein